VNNNNNNNNNLRVEELKQKFATKTQRQEDTGKIKTNITKINCLGQTVRNFIISLDRHRVV